MHYAALQTLRPCWRTEDGPDFEAMADAVVNDLGTLGILQKTTQATRMEQMSELGRFGVGYVIRGSRMGSALLKKRLPSHCPSRYLDLEPQIAWRQFLGSLDQLTLLRDPGLQDEVIFGAACAFDVFAGEVKINLARVSGPGH
jgi:heme oxygenase